VRAKALEISDGVRYYPAFLSAEQQQEWVKTLHVLVQQAPFFTPIMPRTGKPFSVSMSNCGSLGWVSDIKGYRYQSMHPETLKEWPAMPPAFLKAWEALSGYDLPPEACLINHYIEKARMGLHQDRDEEDFSAPVLSLSLGDSAVFRIGGTKRNDPTQSFTLHSGDALVFGGAARLAFHGVDRVLGGTSRLLTPLFPEGGRFNLTFRRVTKNGIERI
jgi:DNA oxidative demethylase